MSSAQKLHILPGVLAGLLPALFQVAWVVLLVMWLGGLDELSRLLGLAGPTFHRVVALSAMSTGVLSLALFLVGAWHSVPLALPVILALVPWWIGVVRALRGIPPLLTGVAGMAPDDRSLLLMQGTGELQCLRLIGAWSSTALLLATAGALLIEAWRYRGASQAPTASPARERKLEAALVALLAIVSWVSAFEALQVAETFFAVVGAEPSDRNTLLAAGAEQLRPLGWLRTGALTGLVLVVLALGRRRLERRPRETVALGSLALVVMLAVGTLWANARPLARMRDALEQADPR